MENFERPPKEIIDKLIEIDGYLDNRVYPTLKEQLELLYEDIKNGKLGEEAKTGNFFQTINKVKTDNPKPENREQLVQELRDLETKYGIN